MHLCEYRPDHDMVRDVPVGPRCGQAATQVLYWRDGRYSPACAAHGTSSLDPEARVMVAKVGPVSDLAEAT